MRLAEFLEREECPINRSQEPMSEQDAMAIRQRMIEKHQEKQRRKGRG